MRGRGEVRNSKPKWLVVRSYPGILCSVGARGPGRQDPEFKLPSALWVSVRTWYFLEGRVHFLSASLAIDL